MKYGVASLIGFFLFSTSAFAMIDSCQQKCAGSSQPLSCRTSCLSSNNMAANTITDERCVDDCVRKGYGGGDCKKMCARS